MELTDKKERVLLLLNQGKTKEELSKIFNIPIAIIDEWYTEKIDTVLEKSNITELVLTDPDTELAETLKKAANRVVNSLNTIDIMDETTTKSIKHMADTIASLYTTFCKQDVPCDTSNNLNVFMQTLKQ